ncbi:hypothetical protein C3L50_03845 [Flavobacterium alvei]|uniref:Uncharacterized protein n=1 Tax=Flavobacterium alvei TaxID=2080416 RepID=A0A2S5AEB1_9FLAO|nr:hypothetical protein [Flavobacterium alvei]POY40639.1 hypothetical protein C3L50_03845 [Flavobacterium alvei]HQE33586.1 hypothetical protein [Flavobacterium alvei]HQF47172.1 hypothetical protein [Flavobacterium alvei]HQK39497.1 hypothetical protein [Flavobacterium alvei]
MIVQYQGKEKEIPTKFSIRIIGNNLSKSSSNYQLELLVGDKQIPTFTTLIHQSLYNCLKEIYLFRKYNQMVFDDASEKIISEYVPYDLVLYSHEKKVLFMA